MANDEPRPSVTHPVRNISDTALWVAYYRALETERPDALFRDPFARTLAGERGERIARSQTSYGGKNVWPFIARTVLFDRFIQDEVRAGADLVVNLAAGLDMRPYRMDLPKALKWVEVDLPDILDYKEGIVGGATPVCRLERVRLDLSNETERRALFARLGEASSRAVILTEGLLIYLSPEQVATLARDLAAVRTFHAWIVEVGSPGLLKMLERQSGDLAAAAGAPFRFAPAEGPAFFEPYGWRVADVRSLLKAAGALGRLPVFLKLISFLPESKKPPVNRPWSAIVKLARIGDRDQGSGR
jgi:methyltransferase (TIGR00027 family)